MTTRTLAITGLVLLIASQALFLQGFDFLQQQKPFDFAHLFMLVGAVLTTAFAFIFPKDKFNTIAGVLTVIGAVAHVGMCSIDFVLWSFGDDFQSRDNLVRHLMNTPILWNTFMVIGPALFYTGLSIHGWRFIKSNTILALAVILGTAAIGAGQFLPDSRILALLGTIVFSVGMTGLAYRKS